MRRNHERAELLAPSRWLALPLILALGAGWVAADSASASIRLSASVGGTAVPAQPSSKSPKKPTAKKPTASATVRISGASCVPSSHCTSNRRVVSLHGLLALHGNNLRRGMVVAFPRSRGASIARNSPSARLNNSSLGLVVSVPGSAHSGRIMILLSHGRHSNSFGPIKVVSYALHPPKSHHTAPVDPPPASGTAFDGQGMWIWYVSKSDGGSVPAIIAQARAAGVNTLYIKSSDGSTNYWSQFSSQLVSELHAAGLKVCAWQYVYGTDPAGEAELGARAVQAGADCLVIDAESEYEKRYAAAQTYIADLRTKIGANYPLGLASFPYVYDHTALPYSVFLGPGGAQYDMPQMYWKAIGNSVDTVYANTYISNRIYGRPIFPLGQTYEAPSSPELVRFREEAPLYGASGISWWDFQETSTAGWTALAAPLEPLSSVTPNPAYSELAEGNKGDAVLWMQEHLAAAVPSQETTGIFDATTKANLAQFQAAHGIAASGHTEVATWQALLALAPIAVNWTGEGPKG